MNDRAAIPYALQDRAVRIKQLQVAIIPVSNPSSEWRREGRLELETIAARSGGWDYRAELWADHIGRGACSLVRRPQQLKGAVQIAQPSAKNDRGDHAF